MVTDAPLKAAAILLGIVTFLVVGVWVLMVMQ
jgi:hypothetical protein